ncbi:hypothetical protein BVY03_04280, partial [bacterium K02(2017)]
MKLKFIFISLVLFFPLNIFASNINQTNWSDGVGINLTSQFKTSQNIDYSDSGELKLQQTNNWYNADWKLRQNINITQTGAVQINYPVKINLTYQNLMQSDFSDLRFTNSNNTILPHWVESKIDSTSAIIWVKVDSLAANSTTNIYMYYANDTATETSNGDSTFNFFDDFSDVTLNADKWTELNGLDDFTPTAGKLVIGNGNNSWNQALHTKDSFSRSDLVMEFDYKWLSNNAGHDALMFGWKDNTSGKSYTNLVHAYYSPGGSNCISNCTNRIYEDGANRGNVNDGWDQDTDYKIRIFLKASGGAIFEMSQDGETWTTSYTSVYSTESDLHPGFALHSGQHQIDNFKVRPWLTTEPSVNLAETESLYEDSGSLTSNIFDASKAGASFKKLSFSLNGNGIIKIRSGKNKTLSDAKVFSSCPSISNNTNLIDTSCINNKDQYIQYQITLNEENNQSPIFSNINIEYDDLKIQANAGADLILSAGREVELNGLSSIGINLKYIWAIFSGNGTLINSNTHNPTIKLPANALNQQVKLTLTVFDDYGQKASDDLFIKVQALPELNTSNQKISTHHNGFNIQEKLEVNNEGTENIILTINEQAEIILPDNLTLYNFEISKLQTFILGLPQDNQNTGSIIVFNNISSTLSGQYNLNRESGPWTKIKGRNNGDLFGKFITSLYHPDTDDESIFVSSPLAENYGTLSIYDSELNLTGMLLGEAEHPIGSLLKSDLFNTAKNDLILGPDNITLVKNIKIATNLIGNPTKNLTIFKNSSNFDGVNTSSLFTPDLEFISDIDITNSITADLNNDQKQDIIISDIDGNIFIFWGSFNPDKTFNKNQANVTITSPLNSSDLGFVLKA